MFLTYINVLKSVCYSLDSGKYKVPKAIQTKIIVTGCFAVELNPYIDIQIILFYMSTFVYALNYMSIITIYFDEPKLFDPSNINPLSGIAGLYFIFSKSIFIQYPFDTSRLL
jgi:hypothetical protein